VELVTATDEVIEQLKKNIATQIAGEYQEAKDFLKSPAIRDTGTPMAILETRGRDT